MSHINLSPPKLNVHEPQSRNHALDAISNKPLFPLDLPEMKTLLKIFFQSSIPATISSLANHGNGLICLKFIGSLDEPTVLAGATLATTWAAAFCLAILLSINLGFTVLASQAFGALQYRRLGILFQRNLFVLGLVGTPLIFSLLFAEEALLWMGLDAKIAMNVGIYLRFLIPSLIATFILEAVKTFLMAQNVFIVGGLVQISIVLVNYFLCYLMVEVFGFGLRGVATAKSMTDIMGTVIIILYVKYSGHFKETWIPWDREAIENWLPHLKTTATIGSTLYVEWISIEASLFVTGALNDEYILGAHGLALSLMVVLFSPMIGNMIAIETYVGNAVGAGYKNKAQKVAFIAFVLNIFYVLGNTVVLLGFNQEVAATFTQDPTTKFILSDMLFLYGIYHCVDSFASAMGAVLRTIGKEREVLIRYVTCYFGIAVGLEYIFAVLLGFSYKGVWISMGIGMFSMFAWMIKLHWTFDWDEAVKKIRKELETKQESDIEYIEMI